MSAGATNIYNFDCHVTVSCTNGTTRIVMAQKLERVQASLDGSGVPVLELIFTLRHFLTCGQASLPK